MDAVQPTKKKITLADSDRIRVVSLNVNVFNYESAIEQIIAMVNAGVGGYVCMSTVHMILESYDDPEYGAKVNAANMVVPDGMPVVWMQKLQGAREPGRVRANDLMMRLCEYAENNDLSVGFYGGRQEVIEAILERANINYPKLRIAYAYSPPFRPLTESEDMAVTEEINQKGPDILFMGLGCPKQENWMSAHKDRLRAVMIGVGASFDFYAGNVAECPSWLQNLGLEWLFRLYQEPRRLWKRYLILNPRFVWHASRQLAQLKKPE